eukprot:CAMPEP_0115850306 /NCGR_PEP_ID=MMETSP0287-20121206/11897_1 /TAXON_ID=412157 /ORGANISM="Chrysochromulina rotalis, Strain UIO044" /LENGTH=302 /DNA_ID=CAMNT_0003304301 /DNA_START=1 /DNA_END=909 /DNA_ORIENTATION=+
MAVASEAGSVPPRSAVGAPATRASRGALALRGGAAEPSDALLQATYSCNQLYSTVLADAMSDVAALRKSVTGGEAVPTFGAKADELISDAVDKFEAEMPKGDTEVSAVYASRAEELRATLVTSLEPVFAQQVILIKDAAMEQFKKGMVGDGDASESLAAAEAAFVREASASVPGKTGWGFKLERASLVGAMQAILIEQKKAQQAKLATAGQMQTALSYLQMQQQQMQALQAQYTGGQGNKWNLGGAYRPPDTNINLSASYQQGRTNLQISMVPDEGANLLGPNGFTQGVGPANLGLSFNVHI